MILYDRYSLKLSISYHSHYRCTSRVCSSKKGCCPESHIYYYSANPLLKYSVAHEYNHAIEGESNDGMIHTILGAVVMEGKADVFASILYPQIDVPWKDPMNTETKEKVVKELMEIGDSSDPRLHLGLRSGNPSKGIPQWANYKIGFEIVQSYIENHPEVSVGKWTSMHEQEIIAGSEYAVITAYEE
jgi:uncharacterized protein YjaZ